MNDTERESLIAFREMMERADRLIEDAKVELVMNPADVTDAVRDEIEHRPLVTLRESAIVEPRKAYLVRPNALRDMGTTRFPYRP